MAPLVNSVCTLTNFLQVREEELTQRKGYTFKARLAHTGKLASKVDKRGYIIDINGR